MSRVGQGWGVRGMLVVCALAASVCASAEPPPEKPTAPASSTTPASNIDPAPKVTTDPSLTGYPWVRLVHPDNPVELLDFALPESDLSRLGVKSSRSYTATTPPVWLLAFEFESQAQLLEAEPKLLTLIEDGPPHDLETAHTGAWLLVTGFPGDKPVSPQMQSARDELRSAWAGEE